MCAIDASDLQAVLRGRGFRPRNHTGKLSDDQLPSSTPAARLEPGLDKSTLPVEDSAGRRQPVANRAKPGPVVSTCFDPSFQVEPEALTTGQVADLLQITQRHVQRLVKQGRMPRPVKLGRCSRWVKSDLIEWLKSGCPPELEKAPG